MQPRAHDQRRINQAPVIPTDDVDDYPAIDYLNDSLNALSFNTDIPQQHHLYNPYSYYNNYQGAFSTQPEPNASAPVHYQPQQFEALPSDFTPFAAYPTDKAPYISRSQNPVQPTVEPRTPTKSTLNAHAPEFVPSFAVLPAEEPLPPDHPLFTPPSVFTPPETTVEHAVQNFERQFPPLPGSKNSPEETKKPVLRKALGWHELEHEQREKVRWERHLDEQKNFLQALQSVSEATDVDEDIAPVTGDVGNVWVSTGQSVAELYEELRAEAAQQASIRNKYFDRAAAAFKRNDGATAKKMGALGREANERMKELHRQAADAIFAKRNPPHVHDVIDLHGLHVSEAIERLPAALEDKAGKIRILTGTGHHTKGTGRARLRPAVKKWLQENEFFFEEVIDANEYVGSFVVDLKKR
ncbi:Polyadenylate-binding protein-interacting protein 7 [Gracilariopsis chorda]|uniref:Polyadenylate-binding protein-interacting protein 7 n=1 Tax=Gracilariopsis chorda TaxID=448386 RepID=A0A2V3J0G0_9FLOR|nr:Polyadenylate-binding protein-interacting protein 7 [Gracilariopsis chorda]|eukprot:PXF47793.1 Polyadenylate-binding protein-interacting protein 7 [Gracilariopsis chorda]